MSFHHFQRRQKAYRQNTDTKRYWNLTNNIYRFAYQGWAEPNSNSHAHTVDERMVSDTQEESEEVLMNSTLVNSLSRLDGS